MLIKLNEERPGIYDIGLSKMTSELFDLTIATVNLLEIHGMSGDDLLETVLDDDISAQGILSAITNTLFELEALDIVDAVHEFCDGEFPHLIKAVPFDTAE